MIKINAIKQKATKLLRSQLFWIQVCAVGIWLLVFQNYFGDQHVYVVDGHVKSYVTGGNIDAEVYGSVEVDNTVPVVVRNTVYY